MWSKVSSQFWHPQASTGGGGVRGRVGSPRAALSLLWPSLLPLHLPKSHSMTESACRVWHFFDDLLLASREGSTLGLEPDIPGPIIWPPPALVSSCIKCSNSRPDIHMRVLQRSLKMLHITFIVLTKLSFIDSSPKVKCSALIWWGRTSTICYQSTEFPPFMQSGLSDLCPEQLKWSVCSIDFLNMSCRHL